MDGNNIQEMKQTENISFIKLEYDKIDAYFKNQYFYYLQYLLIIHNKRTIYFL